LLSVPAHEDANVWVNNDGLHLSRGSCNFQHGYRGMRQQFGGNFTESFARAHSVAERDGFSPRESYNRDHAGKPFFR
jgi:hypothetical protein